MLFCWHSTACVLVSYRVASHDKIIILALGAATVWNVTRTARRGGNVMLPELTLDRVLLSAAKLLTREPMSRARELQRRLLVGFCGSE